MSDQISIATWTGVAGFPGVAHVMMVDEVNSYVLCKLKPWTVYQPGIDQYVTVSEDKTYTNAEFAELSQLSITAASIKRGTYDAQRGLWTYPAVTAAYIYT